ncbi:efflux RND transporter periplasmic adaptor subunit [Notoacmeibacter sp. MSK16QG-6]|uniref:efflux RND transporter periplasmic adaptor subunit n=1 Tax=Notoacmeibacter sp. MSK16QG-6 TaxID=2957982 RepID=UPI00209F562C|nr:HlyD family efflux transporter periplasmic adaptor subunit [Notoacmeibacter sp. MSK16QG-6]MCP1199610.1 HlyD family efflux transporter periplasmic adaptor subunit [Notoacmeibacter sp. MSK16QG-6]
MNRPAPSSDFKWGSISANPDPSIKADKQSALTDGSVHSTRLADLVRFEGRLRMAQSYDQLGVIITTELDKNLMPGFRRAFLFGVERNGLLVLRHASHVSRPDRDAPEMNRLESAINNRVGSLEKIEILSSSDLPAVQGTRSSNSPASPLGALFAALMPLLDCREFEGERTGTKPMIGALLLEFDHAPRSDDPVLNRIAQSCGHALSLFAKAPYAFTRARLPRLAAACVASACILGLVPVPLSALAPAEIVANEPFIVAAPIDGIVRSIEVMPNSAVSEDDLLFTFDDTELSGRETVARETLAVAAAREQRIRQASFSDPAARRELAEVEAARRVAEAEFRQAEIRLARTEVRAARDGIALFSRPDRWIGRPVSTGERIMEIADPKSVRLRAELPVGDANLLAKRPPFRLFLDGRPFDPLRGRIVGAGYRAEVTPDNRLAYILTGKIEQTEDLRIGMRGTAQLLGDHAPLAYYLFRRPVAALRQRLGL